MVVMMSMKPVALAGLLLTMMCHCWSLTRCFPRSIQWPNPIVGAMAHGAEDKASVPAVVVVVPPTAPPTPLLQKNTSRQQQLPLDLNSQNSITGHLNASNVHFSSLDEASFLANETDGHSDQNYARRIDFLRERKKQQRIVAIQTTILERLGISQTPNISSPHLSDVNRKRMARMFEVLRSHTKTPEPDDVYAERFRSFYPSCTLPRNTDKEVWEDPSLFHIFYDVPVPRHVHGTVLTVSSAKLRLYKSSTPLVTFDLVEPSLPFSSQTFGQPIGETTPSIEETTTPPCDERFRITVFQFTRPLKKSKRVKKSRKLIDSRMVAVDFEGWVEFDIKSSIRDWMENPSKNLGLEIVLEDSLSNIHRPAEFLHAMNCTEGRFNEHPFPRFMEDQQSATNQSPLVTVGDEDSATNGSDSSDSSSASWLDNETFPTLNLRTVELLEPSAEGGASSSSVIKNNDVSSRKRRSSPTEGLSCNQQKQQLDGSSSTCCAAKTYVTFEELGLKDWIIYPRGFSTAICMGSCGVDSEESVVSQCVPHQKSSVDVLAFVASTSHASSSSTSPRIIRIPDVVTESCRCQLDEKLRTSTDE